MPVVKLNRRTVTALKAGKVPTSYYDDGLTGFGLLIRPTGARSWFVEYRPGVGGRGVAKRRMVIGSPDTLSPERARDAAAKILAKAELGGDPAAERGAERADITVADLCDIYLRDGVEMKKASTITTDRSRIERHIKPLLGRKRVAAVTSLDVKTFMKNVANGKTARDVKTGKRGRSIVRGGKGAATRTVRLLGGIFTFAVEHKYRTDNPVHGVEKYPDGRNERYLTTAELNRLGTAIHEGETAGIPHKPSKSKHAPKEKTRTVVDQFAAAAIRLLIFTGSRLGEILNLRWAEVDLERGLLFLPDSKTGRKTVVLAGPAIAVLEQLPKAGIYVIAGETAGAEDEKPRADLNRPWRAIRRRAGLEDLRLHDLRHSFASVGAGAGLGLPVIGKLLGHTQASTTARYAHLDADPVRRAANTIAGHIAAALKGGE
ncbi:MAG: tyrosine-type recombinase/integrase [Rhizobiales bacterium]|jgi:integrase|nr:tyrosine-type recombinase/integrase [Hyphomicrobiales bacterium]